jgi:hypothetical protein
VFNIVAKPRSVHQRLPEIGIGTTVEGGHRTRKGG